MGGLVEFHTIRRLLAEALLPLPQSLVQEFGEANAGFDQLLIRRPPVLSSSYVWSPGATVTDCLANCLA